MKKNIIFHFSPKNIYIINGVSTGNIFPILVLVYMSRGKISPTPVSFEAGPAGKSNISRYYTLYKDFIRSCCIDVMVSIQKELLYFTFLGYHNTKELVTQYSQYLINS